MAAPTAAAAFRDMTDEALLDAWMSNAHMKDLATRDALVELMEKRALRPTAWSQTRDRAAGLYPDVLDPDFAARLYEKTEMVDLRSKPVTEDVCTAGTKGFDTTPVQRLVARFLHPMTPYHGLLLDHGVGVGKTCTAITVAETFLEAMPQNKVTILCPQAIAAGFQRTLFDVEKLVALSPREAQLRGESWESPQCTGMTYLRLTDTANTKDRTEIKRAVEGAIRRRYRIMGYLQFANYITKRLATEIDRTLGDEDRKAAEDQFLHKLFSDHLLIVDEAHNLRDIVGAEAAEAVADAAETADTEETESPVAGAAVAAAEGKRLTPVLRRILRVTEGMRLMLMTATPMYNTAPEILFLLNLLLLNDTKKDADQLQIRDFFSGEGALLPGKQDMLRKVCGRYISYMRGENPASFPLRLMPPEAAGAGLFDGYPTKSISKMEGVVKWTAHMKRILSMLPLVVHRLDPKATHVGRALHALLSRDRDVPADEFEETQDFVLDRATQMANITYPNGTFGSEGWATYLRAVGDGKLRQFAWREVAPDVDENEEDENEWLPPKVDDVFGPRKFERFSPKGAAIVKSVTAAKGPCFVFSRYVNAGVLPIGLALERAGWTRVLHNGAAAPLLKPDRTVPVVRRQCALCTHKEDEGHDGHAFVPACFVLLTGVDPLTPDFKGTLRYATTLQNDLEIRGGKVKVILGSQITAEGLDLKCIRENHIFDGWYHLNRIEQVIGRAVRFCSHQALPAQERNCLIYLHTVMIPQFETADLYAYRLATRKSIPIGQVQRIIKETAWDCLMNREAIVLRGARKQRVVDGQGRVLAAYNPSDRPYTSICDFQEACEYACSVRAPAADTTEDSTYQLVDARRQLVARHAALKRRFAEEVSIPVLELQDLYKGIPWEIAALGLRDVLDSPRYIVERKDGSRGTLHLQNGYIVFQPLGVTDTRIPRALRFGRAFGRLPRTMELPRGTLLEPARGRVVQEDMLGEPQAPAVEDGVATDAAAHQVALAGLHGWLAYLRDRVYTTDPKTLLAPPPGLTTGAFWEGLRWVFYHFGGQGQQDVFDKLGAQWWMDNQWTLAARRAVLAHWTEEGVADEDRPWSTLLKPVELFAGSGMRGYHAVDVDKRTLQAFCMFDGEAVTKKCPSNLLEDIGQLMGPAVHKERDTGPLFGFLGYDKKAEQTVFKTVNKKDGSYRGAQCDNTSNLTPHEARIQLIQQALLEHLGDQHPFVTRLLDSNPDSRAGKGERLKRQELLNFRHVNDLPKNHMCRYMEFLLRWMDLHRVDGKRWFLVLSDAVRSGL
jgi:hypothetical protein